MDSAQVAIIAALITLWGVADLGGTKSIQRELAKIEAARGCK